MAKVRVVNGQEYERGTKVEDLPVGTLFVLPTEEVGIPEVCMLIGKVRKYLVGYVCLHNGERLSASVGTRVIPLCRHQEVELRGGK